MPWQRLWTPMAALNRTGLHTEPRHEVIAATLLRVGTLATSSQLSILWADLYPSTHAAPHRAALRCSKSTVAASILSMTLLRTTVQVTATPSFIDLRVPWRDPFRAAPVRCCRTRRRHLGHFPGGGFGLPCTVCFDCNKRQLRI